MVDWARVLLRAHPEVLLGGCRINEVQKWKGIFREFWELYRGTNPDHVVFSSNLPLECCVPYFLHGDEGKTLRSRSMMIESFQPVISRNGPLTTNESGNLGVNFCMQIEFSQIVLRAEELSHNSVSTMLHLSVLL